MQDWNRRPNFAGDTQTIHEMLLRIKAIPLNILPEGKARSQLDTEATAGDMTDAWSNPQALNGWIIERRTPGRRDARWSPTEWIAYVQAGMPDTPMRRLR